MKEIIDVTELKEPSSNEKYYPKKNKSSEKKVNKAVHKDIYITFHTTQLPETGHPSGNIGMLGLGIILVVLAGGIFVKSKR